jgi:hypothetical protein
VHSSKFYWALGAAVLYAGCWWWVRRDVQRQSGEGRRGAPKVEAQPDSAGSPAEKAAG